MNHTTYENKHTEHWDRNGKQYLLDGKQRCQILGWEKTTEYHTFIFFFFFTGQRSPPPFGGCFFSRPFLLLSLQGAFHLRPTLTAQNLWDGLFPNTFLGFMGYCYLFNSIVNIDPWNAIGHMMRKNCMNLVGYTYIDGLFFKTQNLKIPFFYHTHTHTSFSFPLFLENIILSSRLDD